MNIFKISTRPAHHMVYIVQQENTDCKISTCPTSEITCQGDRTCGLFMF